MNLFTKTALLFTVAVTTAVPTLGLFANDAGSSAQALTHKTTKKYAPKKAKIKNYRKNKKSNYRASGRTCGRVSFYSPEKNAMGGWSGVGSAASKTLPFGTRLNVRTQGGRVYNVVINDRGPYIAGRDLDIVSNNPYANGVQNACW
jgi:rare lipoprotein A (peptidoglycan hydrolase)